MSETDYDPNPVDKAAADRLSELVGKFMRCPRCHQGVHRDPDAGCPICGTTSSLVLWEKFTIAAPVQVEELNGGLCRKCGEPVTTLFPKRSPAFDGPIAVAFLTLLFIALFLTPLKNLGPFILMLLEFALGLPLIVLAIRYRNLRLFETCIVICDGCRRVNIGGAAGAENARRFRRGRAAAVGARWLIMPAFYFLTAITLYTALSGGPVPPASTVTLGLLALGVIYNRLMRRTFLPPPRTWWEKLRPW